MNFPGFPDITDPDEPEFEPSADPDDPSYDPEYAACRAEYLAESIKDFFNEGK